MILHNSPAATASKALRIIACLLTLMVLVEAGIATVLLSNALERRDTWSKGVATVSALEKRGEAWEPVFKLTADGREYSIRSSVSSNPPAYRVGEQVEMLYPAENPREAVTNSFGGLYVWPTVLYGMAVMESVLVLGLFIGAGYLRRRAG